MRESDRVGAVEAILFVSSEPVTVQQVVEALEGQATAQEAVTILEALQEKYERESPGLKIERVAEGFRLVTRPACGPFVRAFLKAQNLRKLTPAAVEALAIVAYKQPATTAEVSAIRGTESGAVLKGLMDKKLIRIAGRKNVVGKPLLYATTKEFLVHFGLNTLEDLPSFREIEEVFRENVRQESLFKEVPPPDPRRAAGGDAGPEAGPEEDAREGEPGAEDPEVAGGEAGDRPVTEEGGPVAETPSEEQAPPEIRDEEAAGHVQ